ncbi:hypothetical protein PR048_017334 [Dryococelus australis]|uniref:Uncharacterized protein n=1 Tax=Dryococelus australis TaxID=614101 RepID=A0ABQ9H982_9NEOP|nr:hypothetical protein PR048_017334 [Dryococelus australis]
MPNDISCVYSTLVYKQNTTPVITFDQQLYWKAETIIHAERPSRIFKGPVVLRGGFHTRMSFLSCIGHFMQDA